MGRNCCHSVLTLALVLFSILSEPVLAQDAISRHWQALIQSSDAGSEEQLRAKFNLTAALRRHDLDAAMSNALDAVEMAKSLGDPQYLKVANADVELTWRMIEIPSEPSISLNREQIDVLDAELRHHIYHGILESELVRGKPTANFERVLHSYKQSASGLTDRYLLVRLTAIDLLVRVYYLNESPASKEINGQLDQLRQQSKTLAYNDGIVISSLVESQTFHPRRDWDEKIAVLERALAQATGGQNQVLVFKCQQALAFAFLVKRKYDEARVFQIQALATAEALGSEPLVVKTLEELALLELAAGRPVEAAIYKDRVEMVANFANLPLLDRYILNRFSVWVYRELGDDDLAQQIRSQLLNHEVVAELERNEKEILRQQEYNNQLAKENSVQEKIISEKNRKLGDATELINQAERAHQTDRINLRTNYEQTLGAVVSTLKFYRYSLLVSVLVLSWMILLQMRSRIKSISKELDSERVVSERSQSKCDELAIRLSRLQRMESLGLMAGSVAHDFNNILVGVMGNAEIIKMKQDTAPESQVDEFVSQRISGIIKSAEKAAGLSRQMLAYAGKQQIERQLIDLNELILQYESLLVSACQEHQTLALELSSDLVVSKMDVTQIEQVVLNLVTNAAEASDNGARICISTGFDRVVEIEDDCSLYGTRTTGGDFCYVEVSDSGRGISQLDMERIFEPFFTNSELGKGLGLSVVYGVITGHDGFVKCSSKVGHGTSFRILLPVSSELNFRPASLPELEPIRQHAVSASSRPPHAKKILVVDDEETVLDLCSQSLKLDGWDVETAIGGQAGVDAITGRAEEFACILVDVVMPEMGASEFLRELDLRGINLPVVVMSGFSQTRLEFFLERPNVVAIVEKPFHLDQIRNAIQNAIEFGCDPVCVASSDSRLNHVDRTNKVNQ